MKKKVITDFILNLIASVLPTLALQLIVYPLVARGDTGNVYGAMITIVSLLLLISNTLGNVLNNVRLLENNRIKGRTGDFNLIILIESFLGFIFVLITSITVYNLTIFHIVLTSITGIVILLYAYFNVIYRLTLNYKMILFVNVCQAIGFFLGFCVYKLTSYWEWIYLFGYGIALALVLFRSPLLKEGVNRTDQFIPLLKKTGILLSSAILFSMLNYADKLLLHPLIGAEAVGIYYIASIFGKIVGMVVAPLNSVILSYLARTSHLTKKSNLLVLLSPIGVAIVGYVVCISVSGIALNILYPNQAKEAVEFMPVTTAIAMMAMLISFYYPFVLKYCNMAWQVFIDAVALVTYIVMGVVLFNYFGLMGFCFGVLFANVLKVVIMISIYCKSVFGDKNDTNDKVTE